MNGQANTQGVSQSKPIEISSKNVPVLVKIISVLFYIAAGLLVIAGILLMISSGFLATIIPILSLFGAFGIIMGIGFLGLAVLYFFVARGLWRGKNWARIVAIIFYCLGIISSIYSIVLGTYTTISSLLVAGLLGSYLLFSKKVKEAFV